jgi:hypothetical protein
VTADLNEWNFQDDFGGKGSTKLERDIQEARKYGTLELLKRDEPEKIVRKRQVKRAYHGGRPPKLDRPAIRKHYEDGLKVSEIADRMSAHPDTIRLILKNELKIYDPNRDKTGGRGKARKKQDRCGKGHDLTKEENVLWTKTKSGRKRRECKTCKYDRQRRYRESRGA